MSEHSHVHSADHNHDFVTANEAHFDAEAHQFDARPEARELAKRVCSAIRASYPDLFNEDKTEVLDFACGSGLVSRELCPYVKSIVGVDISQNMVDLYNLRVNEQGLSPEEMRAIRVTLKGEDVELDGAKFDVVVCVASYHHFPDIAATTRTLSFFLKPGGSLLVLDILNEVEPNHDPSHPELLDKYKNIVVHKSGFTEAEIRDTLQGAGLVNFDFRIATQATLHGRDIQFFLARGVRT